MSVDRGFTWLDDETLTLIEIWGKDEIQDELHTAKRNFCVYERIAQELSEVGYSRTAYQCREKIKRLRKEYHLARYCVVNGISQKKPMKYYEQVDQVLSRDNDAQGEDLLNLPYSDPEEEWQFNLKGEFETPSSSQSTSRRPEIVSIASTSSKNGLKMRVRKQSEEPSPDSNDTLIDNGEECNTPEEGSDMEDQTPWVPNVVLVENDENSGLGSSSHRIDPQDDEEEDDENKSHDSTSLQQNHKSSDHAPPPSKRPRLHENPKASWFKSVMDRVTEKFLNYQEIVDSRFLDRIASLERERIKRDEAIQKLWIEFEEKRRKEEQQHELKMMSLFGQFVNQILCGEDTNSK